MCWSPEPTGMTQGMRRTREVSRTPAIGRLAVCFPGSVQSQVVSLQSHSGNHQLCQQGGGIQLPFLQLLWKWDEKHFSMALLYSESIISLRHPSPFLPPLPPLAHPLSSLTFPLPKLLLMDSISFYFLLLFFWAKFEAGFFIFLNWCASDFLLSQLEREQHRAHFLHGKSWAAAKQVSDYIFNYFISVSYFLDDLPNKTWYLFLIFLRWKFAVLRVFTSVCYPTVFWIHHSYLSFQGPWLLRA